ALARPPPHGRAILDALTDSSVNIAHGPLPGKPRSTHAMERPMTAHLPPTLTRDDYCSDEVFALERARIFHAGWFYACHVSALPPGHRRVVDVAGESVIVARTVEGTLHAHANVCRHRGAQLCDATEHAARGSI